jgi:adenylate cyclase
MKIRIGINTGEMVVGNMGGTGRFDYTVIGDSVNIASRLEGANKMYGTGVLISERTYELVSDHLAGRELDLITVKGRTEPLRIYELCRPPVGNDDTGEFLRAYHTALTLYRQRRWADAQAAFNALLRDRPEDGPSRLHAERSALYAVHPPPDNWNGVFVMDTK